MERNPVYGAGPQPPTAATGGDGVVVLENPAYSQPRDLQTVPDTQPPTATVGWDRLNRKTTESMNQLIFDLDIFMLFCYTCFQVVLYFCVVIPVVN